MTNTSPTFTPVYIGAGTAVHLSSGRPLCNAFARNHRPAAPGAAPTCPKCIRIAQARTAAAGGAQ